MATNEFLRFKKLLSTNNYFVTVPRMRLFALLQKHPALTLKEVIQKAHRHDQSTVYRNIQLFEQLRIVNRVRLGWQTKIELSDAFQHHHHHLTCLNCTNIFDLPEHGKLEQEINNLASLHGFTPTDHQLEIRGLCKKCTKGS